MAWEHPGVTKLRCPRRNSFQRRGLRTGTTREIRAGTDGDYKSHAGRQSPAGDPHCLPARELEARWSARGSRKTRLKTHDAVLQNETPGHRGTFRSLGRLTLVITARFGPAPWAKQLSH